VPKSINGHFGRTTWYAAPSGTNRRFSSGTNPLSTRPTSTDSPSSVSDGDLYHVDLTKNIVSCKIPLAIPEHFPRFPEFLWENTERFRDRDALVRKN
jgi:hypothetical protein